MTITPQKEALYSLVGSRAGLYQRLFQQQRENAAPAAIDQTLSALATAESEIRRLSDEVNSEVWYRNYATTFATLEGQGTAILAALGELQRGQSALQAGFRALDKAMKRLEQRVGVIEHELNTRYEESKSARANLHAGMLQMRADLDALKQRMDHIEQRINDEAR